MCVRCSSQRVFFFLSGHICALQKGCTNRNSNFLLATHPQTNQSTPILSLCYFLRLYALFIPFFLNTNEYKCQRQTRNVEGHTGHPWFLLKIRPYHQFTKKSKNKRTNKKALNFQLTTSPRQGNISIPQLSTKPPITSPRTWEAREAVPLFLLLALRSYRASAFVGSCFSLLLLL